MYEMKACIKGTVQGVFFRKTLRDHAQSLGLSGYAENLSDGSVQVIVQGNKEELEIFIQKVKQNPGYALIHEIDYTIEEAKKRQEGFQIL